ncbi:MAG: exodeoxyribonuclease IX [Gammaproteobacteria bacterium]|nr:exodeoxyribonuclease IX [Gammaproteobacteria bacterium]NND59905.1 exodeoxyribonuclease IX [Gammaproteobacteria bacterium]
MIHLIDASVYVFRAWFSLPDSMTDADGNPVNAFYGYARFLGDFLERTRAPHVVVAFDESLTTSYRNEIYPEYKANRDSPPAELVRQFALCRALTRAFGITEYASPEYEADDIIGTLATAAHRDGTPVCIVTRDKDLAQLIREGDQYWDFAADKRMAYTDVETRFGVPAEAIADLLALTGDAVDNIPGVPGIGPKTAAALLQHFGTLDAIYERLSEVAQLPIRGAGKLGVRLEQHAEQARLSRQLTVIAEDVPIPATSQSMQRQPFDLTAVNALYDELGFGERLREQAARIAAL